MIGQMWRSIRTGLKNLRMWLGTEPPPPRHARGVVSGLQSSEPPLLVRAIVRTVDDREVDPVEDMSWAYAETTVHAPVPVEHVGAVEGWSPTQELETVAPVGVLDPEERELHDALDQIENDFHRGMRQLMAFIQKEWEFTPADELALAGV